MAPLKHSNTSTEN